MTREGEGKKATNRKEREREARSGNRKFGVGMIRYTGERERRHSFSQPGTTRWILSSVHTVSCQIDDIGCTEDKNNFDG